MVVGGGGGGDDEGGKRSHPNLMGVYESADHLAVHRTGMHWHPHERYATSGLVYDPSRDLSPNLPVHSCDSSSMNDIDRSTTNSNCSTPTTTPTCHSTTCLPPSSCAHLPRPPPPPCNNNCSRAYPECGVPYLKVEQPGSPPTPTSEEDVVCAGCGHRVQDRFYLQAVDRRWHAACLQCCQCRMALDGEVTCFARDGNIYCKKDYYRIFGMKRCARCQASILSTELVLRARDLVFHVHCFSCTICNSVLSKGEHFGMRDGNILCRLHYEISYTEHCNPPIVPNSSSNAGPYQGGGGNSYPPPFPSPDFHHRHSSPLPIQPLTPGGPDCNSPTKVPNFFNGNATGTPRQKGRPRKRKPKDLEASLSGIDLNADYLDVSFGRSGPGTPGMPGSNSSRTKRMRTSFKHHQLRTMKSYFAINHNPDAKDLKQLSQKTGLPKRVLQVWFQNARAKWRRLVLKQEGKSGDKICSGSESGGLDLESYSSADFHQSMPSQQSPPYILGDNSPSSLECS